MAQAADRMTELTQALLLLAREAPLDVDQEVVNLREAAEDAVAPFRDSLTSQTGRDRGARAKGCNGAGAPAGAASRAVQSRPQCGKLHRPRPHHRGFRQRCRVGRRHRLWYRTRGPAARLRSVLSRRRQPPPARRNRARALHRQAPRRPLRLEGRRPEPARGRQHLLHRASDRFTRFFTPSRPNLQQLAATLRACGASVGRPRRTRATTRRGLRSSRSIRRHRCPF